MVVYQETNIHLAKLRELSEKVGVLDHDVMHVDELHDGGVNVRFPFLALNRLYPIDA